MPTTQALSNAQVVESYNTFAAASYIQLAGVALVLYDYVITFNDEVALFWTRGFTGASLLFFIVRYSAVFNYAALDFAIAYGLRLSGTSCASYIKALTAYQICLYIPWAAFSAMRVFALSGMHWPLTVAVFVFSIGPIAANLVLYGFDLTGVVVPHMGCVPQSAIGAFQEKTVSLVSRITLTVGDIIVVAVTVSTTCKRMTLHTGGRRSSLGDVLFRDGIKYFVVLLSLNMTQVVLTLLSIKPGFRGESYIPILSEPLTAIFISRFLLDLQAANQAARKLGSRTLESLPNLPSSDETLTFAARIIGSFGASTGPDFAYLERERETQDTSPPRARSGAEDPEPVNYDSGDNEEGYLQLGASLPPHSFSASEVTIAGSMSHIPPTGGSIAGV